MIVTFDNYACGETGGSDAEITFDRWGKDIAAVYRFVQCLPGTDWRRVGLIGISSGSEAALRCAISYETPAFIVSIATCVSPNYGNWPAEVLCRELDALQRGETARLLRASVSLKFFLDAVGRAPIYRIGEVKCPVFFLQGQADNAKRRGDALMGYEYMKKAGLRCKHLEIPAGNHGLDNVVDQRSKAIRSWLTARCNNDQKDSAKRCFFLRPSSSSKGSAQTIAGSGTGTYVRSTELEGIVMLNVSVGL